MFSKHFAEVDLSNCLPTVKEVEGDRAEVCTQKDADSPNRFLKRIAIGFWNFSLYYGTWLSASPDRPENAPGAESPSTERS